MTALGDEVLLALADQAWGISFQADVVILVPPITRVQVRAPQAWFEDEDLSAELGMLILALMVFHGFRWQNIW